MLDDQQSLHQKPWRSNWEMWDDYSRTWLSQPLFKTFKPLSRWQKIAVFYFKVE